MLLPDTEGKGSQPRREVDPERGERQKPSCRTGIEKFAAKAELESSPCVRISLPHESSLDPDGPDPVSQGHRAASRRLDGEMLLGAVWAMTGGQARMTGQPMPPRHNDYRSCPQPSHACAPAPGLYNFPSSYCGCDWKGVTVTCLG